MTTAIVTALTWLAFLAFFFYRYARDLNLNFQTGRIFRALVVEGMTSILDDDAAPPMAMRCADRLLSLVYDRSKLKQLVKNPPAENDAVTFPAAELGKYASAIQLALKYVTILGMLEQKSYGNSIRKFLRAGSVTPLDAVAQVFFQDDEQTDLHVPSPAWSDETVTGFVHSPPGRRLEHAIEGMMACTA